MFIRRLPASSLLVCLLLSASLPLGAEESRVVSAADIEVPVITAKPQPLPTQDTLVAIGRLEAADEIDLSFKTGGVIAAILVDIGDPVKKGQVLARLDSTEIDAEVRRAEESLAKTERDLARVTSLQRQGLVSQEALDNAGTARDLAAAAVQAARFNLDQATILAPAPGRVLSRRVQGREVIGPGVPVLTVSGEGKGWLLRASVSDRAAMRVAPGQAAFVKLDALPGESFTGHVRRVAGQAHAATGMFDIEIGLEAAPVSLRSGMIGRGGIMVPRPPTLGVPLTALIQARGAAANVVLVRDGRAVLQPVRIGEIVGHAVEVREGLGPDDDVVISGAAYVNAGQRVRPLQP
jgi:multidrug efflux system membrane fusion protein